MQCESAMRMCGHARSVNPKYCSYMHITDSVIYMGVDDHTTTLFESLWPLPAGVSYNSYLVKGEATALIDTAEIHTLPEFLCRLRQHNVENIDYLVVNHMEPDHSGLIPEMKKLYPEMKIVGNALTVNMIKCYYNIDGPQAFLTVKDGDTLDLGNGHVLSFHTIPMVHWPETMVTYLACQGVLFSGDAFGTFGALNGAVTDSMIGDPDVYFREMRRYYACIVAKYATPVQNALAKLGSLELKYICSTHGPVWEKHLHRVIEEYDRLSSHKTQPGVVIAYGSMYGHTARMAEVLAQRLAEKGVANIKVYNVATTDLSFILADIWKYNGLIIGGPTYNASVFPPVKNLLDALKMRGLKNHVAAAFGSFTWASASCAQIAAALSEMKLDMAGNPVDMKMEMSDETECALCALADAMAQKINI